jgi:pimeloyl-ACP methyl ester carboxylesterase
MIATASARVLTIGVVTLLASHAVAQTPPASGIAEVNGTRLYYERTGSGPVVVLLHGGNLDSRMWDDQVPVLAKSFTVIRYDIRPYGRSAATQKGFSSVEDLRALLDYLGVKSASLVGLSLGGRIAVDFALAHPSRVEKLVLMGPGLTGYAFNPNEDEAMKPIMAKAREGDAAGAMDLWLQHPMMAPAMARPKLAARIREIAKDNLQVWRRLPVGEQVPTPPAIERLGDINAPTLIIVGELDVPDIQAIVNLLGKQVKGARTEVIPRAAHMPNMEDPARVNRLLVEFLRSPK